jgi:hypothetical protein
MGLQEMQVRQVILEKMALLDLLD